MIGAHRSTLSQLVRKLHYILAAVVVMASLLPATAQEYGTADRDAPGDEMIQQYLAKEAARIHGLFAADLAGKAAWENNLERFRQEYLYMLGLWPQPEKTPLKPTVTGTLDRGDYVVEKLHFQSRPRLYVTGNLYRPAKIKPGQRLPTVVYVCGHSYQGRNGNKTAYQSHGIWFARHGMICLMIDTLQLSEINAIHHGTYREERWWWHARGYTSAGVECWNGIRAVDYLQSRDDVDRARIGVTGISGGGAASFWIAAADPRIAIAAPVSGMADLPSYVTHRVINGHCDCMFLYNTFQWPWTRIASLIAPRPLRFVNSDQDRIFPMDANDRIINRLERIYSLYGASASVDAVVSIGGHAYREDLRRAVFRFFRTELLHDPAPITDSEVDLVVRSNRGPWTYPIAPEDLRVFATDDDLPKDELNTTIDEHFVPLGNPGTPSDDELPTWRENLKSQLGQVVFRSFPTRIPPAKRLKQVGGNIHIETEPGIRVWLTTPSEFPPPVETERIVLLVRGESGIGAGWLANRLREGDRVVMLEPRGTGATRWTRKNPPNYVERAHVLVGQTVDTGRIRDVIAAARLLAAQSSIPVVVAGKGRPAGWAAYAGLWEDEIAQVWCEQLAHSHMADHAPQLLNVLRVCDLPHIVKMLGAKLQP